MKILVISGGTSPEREVSLRSGKSVQLALESQGHEVMAYDPAGGSLAAAVAGIDLAFPVLHGVGGEDGTIQQELEETGMPYVGTGVAASRLCFNKAEYKDKLRSAGIPTPSSALVTEADLQQNELIRAPFVLKPFDGGSSIDTFIVRDPAEADFIKMRESFSRHGSMLLEELIEGQEITVGVLGAAGLPVIEIIPPESGEFDYENKYNGASQELCPPQHIAEDTQAKARELAATIHMLCDCADFTRTDMIVRPDGSLMVLETNTIPGLTDQSLFPKAAAAAGYTMPELCEKLVELALSRQTANA
jgi:D-alanine-D-alanine ligase